VHITSLFALAAASFYVTATHAQVASFDCTKAGTATEHAICATPSLGKKDIVLATYYDLLLNLPPAVGGMAYREFDDQIRDSQRTWVKSQRDPCQGNAGCLQRVYDERLAKMRKLLNDNAAMTFGRRCQD
jgi:uncharacterized protein